MKKLLIIFLVLALTLSFCACTSKSAEALPQSSGTAAAEAVSEAAAETAEETEVTAEDEIAAARQLFTEGNYDEAFKALSALDGNGDVSVTEMLGQCWYFGMGTETDTDKALELLKKAAEGGSVTVKYLLADAAANINGARLTLDETAELYKEFVSAAEAMDPSDPGYGTAMTYLADCYANGRGTERDSDKALDAAAKASKSEGLTPFDMMTLGKVFEDCVPVPEDEASEEQAASAVAENPDAEAAAPVTVVKEAEELYSKAADALKALAEAGNARAQKLLGDLYFGGKGGFEQDYGKALELYEQAADQDYADAQAQLGYMYQNGIGVELSYEKAMEWNNRAAQQGNAQGQAQIGYMYHMGLGVTQNLDEAGRWYARAAQQGDSWAADMLIQTEVTNPQSVFEAHA